MIPREKAEEIAASCDRTILARMAYREAFPNPAVHINGQAVLDLTTGEVRPSAYVEGHAQDLGFVHLLSLMECEAKLKERLSEEEFVRMVRDNRIPEEETTNSLDAIYSSQRALAQPFERSEGSVFK